MAEKHYSEQIKHTENYLIPYFKNNLPNFNKFNIIEVGCAEGGGLKVLNDFGLKVTGIEISPNRVRTAKEKNPELTIHTMDITDSSIVSKLEKYDLIILRDVIEHVPDRISAFNVIYELLKEGGFLYITFPPKYSGFAGHQQNGRSIMKRLPFIHILPDFLIRSFGRIVNEKPKLIEDIIKNFKDGLSIRAFEKYYSRHGLQPVVKELFLFRPVFRVRFNLNPKKVPNIPLLREVIAFGCEYLLQKPHSQ